MEDLQDSIQKFYSNSKHQKEVTKSQLEQDKFFAALHSDKNWYRVRVNSFLDEYTVAVRFVDYGDHAMISISNLQVLRSQFRNLSMQAVNACLAGEEEFTNSKKFTITNTNLFSLPFTDIVPTNSDWTTDDVVWFSSRVYEKQFVSVIKGCFYSPEDGVTTIKISLVDTTHPAKDVYVERELVDSERAVFLCV